MKDRSSVYFRRLIAFCILISIIPVLILGVFSYFRSSNMIKEKVNESNLQVLHQTQMTVEESLKLIHNYYTLLAYSEEVTELIDDNLDYQDIEAILQIQEDLKGLMKTHAIIKNAYLINFNRGWFISNETAGSLDSIVNKDEIFRLVDESKKNICWTYIADEGEIDNLTNYIDVGNISMIIKIPFNEDTPKAGIIVSLSQYEFNKLFNSSGKTERLLIADENNRILYDDDHSNIGQKLDKYPLSTAVVNSDTNEGFFKNKLNDREIGVNFTKSEYNGWTYISIYSIEQITKDSKTIGWMTFLLSLATMAVSMGLSTLGGAKIVYKPIKKIYDSIRKEIPINESEIRRDEVQYIEKGVNTLITSRNIMEQQIKAQLQQIRELFLIRLLNGEIGKKELELKSKSLDISTDWDFLSMMTIEIDILNNQTGLASQKDIVMLEINRIIEEVIGEQIFLKPIFIKQVQSVIVKGEQISQERFNDIMYRYAELIQSKVKERLDVVISIGISQPYKDLLDTPIAYKESVEALRCRIALGENVILFFHEVQPGQRIRQHYPKNMENELIDAINAGDEEEAEELLDQIIDQILSAQASFSEYQIYFTRLLVELLGILQDSGEYLDSFFEDNRNIFEELNQCTNAEDVKHWFKEEIIGPIISIRKERNQSTHKKILREIIEIVENEYDTDLTLEECAARLHYHPSYIWRIMKKEMGVTFSEYLSQYRLKIAKQWLEETDMTIAEIATRLRYNNAQNFIRYFKKLEGITPGRYRKKVRSKK
mgnify:FL=1